MYRSTMSLNSKNIDVETLARAGKAGGGKSLRQYLEQNVWPMVPAGELGRHMTREEEDQILGYGPEGY